MSVQDEYKRLRGTGYACAHGRQLYVECPECELLAYQISAQKELAESLSRLAGALRAISGGGDEG